MERDEMHDLLDLWSTFMGRNDHALEWRGKDPILRSEGARESEQLYDDVDRERGEAMGAVVESLAPHHQWALWRRYGLTTVWRFSRLDYTQTLRDAVEAARIICRRRGLLHETQIAVASCAKSM